MDSPATAPSSPSSASPPAGAFTHSFHHPVHAFGTRRLDVDRHVGLMAVINRTPDFFYDCGGTFTLRVTVDASPAAVEDGTDTHSFTAPHTAHPRPTHDDVVRQIVDFPLPKVDEAVALGIPEDRLLLDPGHDLNKNTLPVAP